MQELGQLADEEAEVVTCGGEYHVDAVAFSPREMIAVHAVFGLQVAEHGFDGGAAPHLALDGSDGAADLAGDPDTELVRMVVPTIALVDVAAFHLDAGHALDIRDRGAEGVAVVWVAV